MFFLLRILKKFDEVTEKAIVLSTDLLVLKDRLSSLDRLSDKLQMVRDELSQMKSDVSTALVAAQKVRELEDQVAILKRDQASIWRRLDENQEACDGRHTR